MGLVPNLSLWELTQSHPRFLDASVTTYKEWCWPIKNQHSSFVLIRGASEGNLAYPNPTFRRTSLIFKPKSDPQILSKFERHKEGCPESFKRGSHTQQAKELLMDIFLKEGSNSWFRLTLRNFMKNSTNIYITNLVVYFVGLFLWRINSAPFQSLPILNP